ncbi:MAG TPA: hypothetical protein ENJ97_00070, partial [Planctomycetes bacterium]|nr:hypothetical protein [Planctomycetota bacterium]
RDRSGPRLPGGPCGNTWPRRGCPGPGLPGSRLGGPVCPGHGEPGPPSLPAPCRSELPGEDTWSPPPSSNGGISGFRPGWMRRVSGRSR